MSENVLHVGIKKGSATDILQGLGEVFSSAAKSGLLFICDTAWKTLATSELIIMVAAYQDPGPSTDMAAYSLCGAWLERGEFKAGLGMLASSLG